MNYRLAFRQICPVCGAFARLPGGPGSGTTCSRCWQELWHAFRIIRLQDIALSDSGATVPVWALSSYEGIVRQALRAFKYQGRRGMAEIFAELIRSAMEPGAALAHLREQPLVPVPATPRGRRRRGFDQMDLIGRLVTSDMHRALVHRRGTQQKLLDRSERLQNAGHLFRLHGTAPPGFTLMDDVLTTGATLVAASRLLDAAGTPPSAVVALTTRR